MQEDTLAEGIALVDRLQRLAEQGHTSSVDLLQSSNVIALVLVSSATLCW